MVRVNVHLMSYSGSERSGDLLLPGCAGGFQVYAARLSSQALHSLVVELFSGANYLKFFNPLGRQSLWVLLSRYVPHSYPTP